MAAIHSLVNVTPNVYNRDYIVWGVYDDINVHELAKKSTVLKLSSEDGNKHGKILWWDGADKTGLIKDPTNGIQAVSSGGSTYLINQTRVIRAIYDSTTGKTTVICGDGKAIKITGNKLADIIAS